MYDITIIGGGIVGLATALKLKTSNPFLNILLLEKENELAKHQTGNNSGVIHSGLYYKPGSLKATNCIHGYHLLIDFCREHEIPFDLCGKIVVASDEAELPLLENLYQRGQQNGLQNLKKLKKEELKD
ncbi:MAG TPA: FAD-dependent oxidoreductase, partial [Cyclobacteriaceae bacterium]|nr:FAD-dependent oxidoreductase [Cyclobacteriaceae bacterium]